MEAGQMSNDAPEKMKLTSMDVTHEDHSDPQHRNAQASLGNRAKESLVVNFIDQTEMKNKKGP